MKGKQKAYIKHKLLLALFWLVFFFYPALTYSQVLDEKMADKPLFRDPVFDVAADNLDLYNWTDSKKKVIGDKSGEGPKVFYWKGKNWMAVDNWSGIDIYYTDDFINLRR